MSNFNKPSYRFITAKPRSKKHDYPDCERAQRTATRNAIEDKLANRVLEMELAEVYK